MLPPLRNGSVIMDNFRVTLLYLVGSFSDTLVLCQSFSAQALILVQLKWAIFWLMTNNCVIHYKVFFGVRERYNQSHGKILIYTKFFFESVERLDRFMD